MKKVTEPILTLQNPYSIDAFLDKKLITKPNTRRLYRTCIEYYFDKIGKDENTYFPHKIITHDEKGEELREPKIVFTTPLNVYAEDLEKAYLYYLNKKKKGYMAIRTYFSAVRQFMVTNNKELKDLDFWDSLKASTKGGEPESEETILNATKIKEILCHGDACARAMFLMLSSSGRRIGEILALTTNDVNINTTPATIRIKKGLVGKEITTTKTKATTTCFISEEAKEAYKAWLLEREAYLQRACKISKYDKDPNDPRVFPMTYDNAKTKWETLLIRAGEVEKDHEGNHVPKRDNKTGRLLSHPHALRKFFRSYLGDADLAEYLMGHATMLTKAYRQMTPEDLGAKYLKFMPNVTIFENVPDLSGINESLKEKDEQMKKMQEKIDGLEEFKMKILEQLAIDSVIAKTQKKPKTG